MAIFPHSSTISKQLRKKRGKKSKQKIARWADCSPADVIHLLQKLHILPLEAGVIGDILCLKIMFCFVL
jgi:hypothetical protein